MEGGLRLLVDYAAAAAADQPLSPIGSNPMSPPPASPGACSTLSPGGSQGSTRRRGPAVGGLPAPEWLPLASRTDSQWNEPTLHVRPRMAGNGDGLVQGDAVEVRAVQFVVY